MKKTKIALGKKLLLNKESITNLDSDLQGHVLGGASAGNICTGGACQSLVMVCPQPIQTLNCISKKHTWCWVAGSSC